jgi:hypothetical protein
MIQMSLSHAPPSSISKVAAERRSLPAAVIRAWPGMAWCRRQGADALIWSESSMKLNNASVS